MLLCLWSSDDTRSTPTTATDIHIQCPLLRDIIFRLSALPHLPESRDVFFQRNPTFCLIGNSESADETKHSVTLNSESSECRPKKTPTALSLLPHVPEVPEIQHHLDIYSMRASEELQEFQDIGNVTSAAGVKQS
jgi:hypothetical protein